MTAYLFNADKFAFEVFADEIVVLDITEGTYFALGGWVVEIWPALAARQPVELIADAISQRYGVSGGTIADELSGLVAKLKDEAILRDAEPTDEGMVLAGATGDFRPLSFEKHVDMQDLLTLDPIHDVDPQKGWPSY
ncbi:PqqD family protein [Mesorhizobium sp. INR15]|uniref:PqqD family protein n=1 Tax=Mesorhizobium sp. INR15 TaxID=2654248 RepID=UPI00189657AF|nr:PqqD family protein [Mesorhizobium sp. INR15]QPC90585.1 PqqD family peptide modification chaperone [Mesorhizobium sp. INR15]